jgi:hypothetical protein
MRFVSGWSGLFRSFADSERRQIASAPSLLAGFGDTRADRPSMRERDLFAGRVGGAPWSLAPARSRQGAGLTFFVAIHITSSWMVEGWFLQHARQCPRTPPQDS